jgi:hypothetical protein
MQPSMYVEVKRMNNTKIILAIAAVALVAAALIGITAAQFADTQTQIATVGSNGQVQPPCVTGNNGVLPPNCINSSTGEPYCYNNDTGIYCNNGNQEGYCQNGGCYGYEAQNQNQPQYGAGMMGNGYGYGMRHCR